jgi:hypothetical protein
MPRMQGKDVGKYLNMLFIFNIKKKDGRKR